MEKDLLKMAAGMNRFGISLPAVKDYLLHKIFLQLLEIPNVKKTVCLLILGPCNIGD